MLLFRGNFGTGTKCSVLGQNISKTTVLAMKCISDKMYKLYNISLLKVSAVKHIGYKTYPLPANKNIKTFLLLYNGFFRSLMQYSISQRKILVIVLEFSVGKWNTTSGMNKAIMEN